MKVDVDLPKILGQSNYYFPNYDDIHSWLAQGNDFWLYSLLLRRSLLLRSLLNW